MRVVLLALLPAFVEGFSLLSSLRKPSTLCSVNTRLAQELITSLIQEEKCFSSISGAKAFGDACAYNVVYEDCFEPQPVVGKSPVTNYMVDKVASRQGKGDVRMDKVSDGNRACGFTWTWVSGTEEGLRGTTFCELNDQGQIQYVREIPEPIYKPGDLTLELLKTVTADAKPKVLQPYTPRTPTTASEIVDYLFNTVQGSSVDESMKFFDESIIYRDFNYENVLRGKDQVKKFIEDFSFPGIEFRAQRIDDGKYSSCFTWEVALMDAPSTIKGISFYELNPKTNLISYVRDIPESAIKPAPLGKIARQFRPGVGVFQSVPIGSRPGGL